MVMKRYITSLLIACMLLTVIPVQPAHALCITASRSDHRFFVNGLPAEITAYNISGANYIRLRELAYAANFSICQSAADLTVIVDTCLPYSGNQLMLGAAPDSAEATEACLSVLVDRQELTLQAYNIYGNNYVKLRDITAAAGLAVEWDSHNRHVQISTSIPSSVLPRPDPDATVSTGETEDHSLEANPGVFDDYYTREKYNKDRQKLLETGTNVNWSDNRVPQSSVAVAAADSLLEHINDMSDYDKIISIISFVCNHMSYSINRAFSGETFWTGSAFGVCEDYSRMFQYICHRAGIPCLFITGQQAGDRHAWNEVYYDNEWHFTDVTLSDSRGRSIVSRTAETANTGYPYTCDVPGIVAYQKELFVPGSTL